MNFDVVIVGASFSGLALAHYLPKSLRVLVLDRKPKLDATIESTGLVTQVTHDMLAELVDVDRFIPNKVTTIGVVSPDYDKYFFSHTKKPWIYTTDTPNLVKNMAETVPQNVTIEINSNFRKYGVNPKDDYPVQVMYSRSGKEFNVQAKFIVGADGSHSQVAKSNPKLSKNHRFLAGLEKVFYGDIHLGDHPRNTVYHFWFGEFSIGYGGWLSPTIINGKHAFRVGLAKLEKDIVHLKLLDKFIQILKDRRIISLADEKCQDAFGSLIPINGVLRNLSDDHSALIGDAAGFCGAFAADGIKGSLVSAKVVAKLLPQRLRGDLKAFRAYKKEVNKYGKLMKYYFKQRLYRFIWDRMKRNRSFHAMFDIIQREKEGFLNQFCDNMKKATSLTRTVLKLHNFHRLVMYSIYIAIDIVFPKKR